MKNHLKIYDSHRILNTFSIANEFDRIVIKYTDYEKNAISCMVIW